MFTLGDLGKKLLGGINKFSGNTDFLNAVCASCALVANADGDISDEEIEAALSAISSNDKLTAAFKESAINKCADERLKRVTAGRTGQLGLYKEVAKCGDNKDMAEIILVAAIDVADADNNIDKDEQEVLRKVAGKLGLSLNDYL